LQDRSTTITSATNASVKYVRSLHQRRTRHKERHYIAEGLRAIEEALKAGIQPAFLFCTPAVMDSARARQILSQAAGQGAQVRRVSESVMSTMADTVAPPGMLAVLPMRPCCIPNPLTLALVVVRLRDPGNLGTILRSALAAGVELVMTSQGTVDVYSPKVVRAAMGAHFRLNLCPDQTSDRVERVVRELQLLLAHPREGIPYWEVNWRPPTALFLGGEAEGAGPEAERLAGGRVLIPMQNDVESLNAAVSAGVLLFEAARQRATPQERHQTRP